MMTFEAKGKIWQEEDIAEVYPALQIRVQIVVISPSSTRITKETCSLFTLGWES